MKLFDFDGLFDEKCAQFMKESKKKRSQKAWEDVIPKLYKQFGDTYIPTVKCTPKQYYARMTDTELAQTLSAHLKEGVPVPEFLVNELEKRSDRESLLPLLEGKNGEAAYAVRLLGGDPLAFEAYFKLLETSADEDLKNEIVGILCEHAEDAKALALANYRAFRAREYVLEILSHTLPGDDGVLEALTQAFSAAEEWQLTRYAGYLAAYGDERALPLLLRKIEDESLGFVEFQELKYAVEALGGEYAKERDFTADKDYLLFEAAKEKTSEDE